MLGLLAMLDGRQATDAAQALAGLVGSRRLLPAAEVLMRWAENRSEPKPTVELPPAARGSSTSRVVGQLPSPERDAVE